MRPRLAIIIPCFNEQEAVPRLVQMTATAFEGENLPDVTVLFVDDGSEDQTWEVIQDQGCEYPDLVTGLRLNSNFGKARAQALGISACVDDFDLIALLDGDGQHDVRSLPEISARAATSGLPQIARREGHQRSFVSSVGTGVLHGLTQIMGITYDPDLAEYVVMPRRVAARVVQSVGFGSAPIVPIVMRSGQRYEEFPSAVLDRIGDLQHSRWPLENLVQKALMHIFIDPWRLVIRSSVAVFLVTVFLGLYGLAIGIGSIVRGDFLGIASVIVVIVGTFVVLALLLLTLMGLLVTQATFADRHEPSGQSNVWRHPDARAQ